MLIAAANAATSKRQLLINAETGQVKATENLSSGNDL
jgi:hypothetical protein